MSAGRLLAAAAWVVAAVLSAACWSNGGLGLAGILVDDAAAYAVVLAWLCLAPLVLGLALVALHRTPWPWVVTTAVHLVVVVAAAARLRHLVPEWAWVGVGASVVLGVASVVVAVGDSPRSKVRVIS